MEPVRYYLAPVSGLVVVLLGMVLLSMLTGWILSERRRRMSRSAEPWWYRWSLVWIIRGKIELWREERS